VESCPLVDSLQTTFLFLNFLALLRNGALLGNAGSHLIGSLNTMSRYVQVTKNIENCLLLAADAITKPSLTMPAELPSIVLLLNRSFVSVGSMNYQ